MGPRCSQHFQVAQLKPGGNKRRFSVTEPWGLRSGSWRLQNQGTSSCSNCRCFYDNFWVGTTNLATQGLASVHPAPFSVAFLSTGQWPGRHWNGFALPLHDLLLLVGEPSLTPTLKKLVLLGEADTKATLLTYRYHERSWEQPADYSVLVGQTKNLEISWDHLGSSEYPCLVTPQETCFIVFLKPMDRKSISPLKYR